MCPSLLSACGSGNKPKTDDPSASGSTPGSVEQKETEKPKESEEPRQEEPNESEEPAETPSAANPAGAEALALLQQEYKNGFAAEGERPGHTYFTRKQAFIYDGILYIAGGTSQTNERVLYGTYDLASKKITGNITLDEKYGTGSDVFRDYFIEHGLKEDVTLGTFQELAADGTVYAKGNDNSLYRLNTNTYEWEKIGDAPDYFDPDSSHFCGKYHADSNHGIYDCITGEYIFEYGELYPPVGASSSYADLSYFGGDKYLGCRGNEYRWVNLKDGTMSEPLPFPEGQSVTIVSDTYCVYRDQYGWFLWDYSTGVEETITLFER